MAVRAVFGLTRGDADCDWKWPIELEAVPRQGDDVIFPAESGGPQGVVSVVFWTPGDPQHDVLIAVDPR